MQQAFLVGISKNFFGFPRKRQNKTKQGKKMSDYYPVRDRIYTCEQNNVKVVMKLRSRWQLRAPH